MGGHNQDYNSYYDRAVGGGILTDPGSGGTVDLESRSMSTLVLDGTAGTRTLPADAPIGTVVFAVHAGTGTIVLSDGVNTVSLTSSVNFAIAIKRTATLWDYMDNTIA